MGEADKPESADVEVGKSHTDQGEPVVAMLWHKYGLDEECSKPVTAIAAAAAIPLCKAILAVADEIVAEETGQPSKSGPELWWERTHRGCQALRELGYELPEDAEEILVKYIFD